MRFQVRRGDQRLELTAILASREWQGRRIGYLGAGVSVDVPPALRHNLLTEHRLSVAAAIPAAAVETVRMCRLTLNFLYRMVLGDVSVRNVSGPSREIGRASCRERV